MNKKILLGALAFPVLFASCTQEEDFMTPSVWNGPNVEGFKVALNIEKSDCPENETRADWNYTDAKLGFTSDDLVSVYWLGNPDFQIENGLIEKYNSIFRTTNGNSFASESMVYLGKSVAVFPGDVTCVEADQQLKINVPAVQDAKTINNIPYVSNVLNIEKKYGWGNVHNTNVAGYHHTMYSPVKLAANNLKLNMAIADQAAGYDLEIQKVTLRSSANAFATSAKLVAATGDVTDKGVVDFSKDSNGKITPINTISNRTWIDATASATEISSTNIVKNADGTYTVNFVVLPTDDAIAADGNLIVVETNCGRIEFGVEKGDTINGVKAVGTQAPIFSLDKDKKETAVQPTVAKLFEDITESKISTTKKGTFEGEQIGKRLTRNIAFSMKRAILTGSKVYNSADIDRYLDLYAKYGKATSKVDADKLMNLVLAAKKGTEFVDLTSATVNNIYKTGTDKNYVTLTFDAGITGINLTTPGAVYAPKTEVMASAATYFLTAGDWTLDQAANLKANVTKIQNNGVLTITNKDNKGVAAPLAYTLVNNATMKFGATEVSLGEFTANKTTSTTVEKGQTVYLAGITELNGTVTNNGIFSAAGSVEHTVVNKGTIDNWFEVSVVKTSAATLTNIGTINNKDAAMSVTYLTNNQDANTMGVINLATATDEIKIFTADAQGYIKYVVPASVTTLPEANAKYNYAIYSNPALTYKSNSNATAIKYLEINGDPTAVTAKGWTITDLIVNKSMRLLGENTLTASNIYVATGGYILHAGGLNGTIKTTYNAKTFGAKDVKCEGVVRSTNN